MAIRRLVQRLKGGSSHQLTMVLAHLRKPFLGAPHLGARVLLLWQRQSDR